MTTDALAQAGERLMIERVRQVLGSGSPNTAAGLPDVCRVGFEQGRLPHTTMLALPDAPLARPSEAANTRVGARI